jgi:hypothetical protein
MDMSRIHANHARLLVLISAAEVHAAAGRREEAAVAAQQAAGWAWLNHAGIHASSRLEALVRALGPPGAPRLASPPGRPARPVRVLHVLTQAYPTGGHTRWSDRIIRADRTRRHSIVLTGQGSAPVPPWLAATVRASGGRLEALAPAPTLERAGRLRRLVEGFDLVIANLHPSDVAAVAALTEPRGRPPVALLNHADHAFWLGVGAADLVVSFRRSGEQLGTRRRGVDPARSAVSALPLDPPAPGPARDVARAGLGIRPDEIVMLTAGSAWKFDPLERRGEPGFPGVLAGVLERDPRLRLFALGPQPDGAWAAASRRTQGRMLALGTRTDFADYQRAADVYLDPFPMGSLYSLLEPVARGVPAISLAQWPEEAAVLMADAPGLGAARLVARDRAAYEAALRSLVDDESGRVALGRAGARDVLAAHSGPAWQAGFEAVVDAAFAAHEAAMAGAPSLGAALDRPIAGVLAWGLATIPERMPPPPDRAVVHLPLAG